MADFKYLHDAITFLLSQQSDKQMSLDDIENQIKELDLWTRPKDGQYPQAHQIGLRAISENHSNKFEIIIKLKD